MKFSHTYKGQEQEITDLFTNTFAASEGADEGALIGGLVQALMTTTDDKDLYTFLAVEDGTIIAGIFLSRLSFSDDDRVAFVLAPVAVTTERHRQGIGQKLIRHGLDTLTKDGVDVAITYGDVNFYGRVGFAPITGEDVPPPFPLEYPEGWLGQSLNGAPLHPFKGPSHCVEAFNDPAFW